MLTPLDGGSSFYVVLLSAKPTGRYTMAADQHSLCLWFEKAEPLRVTFSENYVFERNYALKSCWIGS